MRLQNCANRYNVLLEELKFLDSRLIPVVLTKHFEYLIDSSADEILISSPDFDLVDGKQGSSLSKKDLIFQGVQCFFQLKLQGHSFP